MGIIGEICTCQESMDAVRHGSLPWMVIKVVSMVNRGGLRRDEVFLPYSTAIVQPKSNLIIRSGTSGKEVRRKESAAPGRTRCLV
jgi:hypothetical protein